MTCWDSGSFSLSDLALLFVEIHTSRIDDFS